MERPSDPARPARPRRAPPRWRLWTRRIHLYSGLALVPWVLLYAVSGLLFNHPEVAAEPGPRRFGLSDLPVDAQGPAELPQIAATAVASALGPEVQLLPWPPPRFTRSLRARTAGEDGHPPSLVSLRFPSLRGSVRQSAPEPDRSPASLREIGEVHVPGFDASAWTKLSAHIARNIGGDDAPVELSATPRLQFAATIDGEPWQVTHDAKDGSLTYESLQARDVRLPRLLARLHMTHVYPDRLGARWFHALIVDLTAACLALWCITGLLMWWQLRRVRRVGLVVLGSGLMVSGVILLEVIPPLLS